MSGNPQEYLTQNLEQITNRLIDFVSIPSVSADRAYAGDVRRAAEWVTRELENAGLERVTCFETPRHPIVYAEWQHAPGKITVLIYGHYDVQPPDPLDKWSSPPFQPEIRNGRLCGRGVSDDKGPVLTAIEVIAAYLKTLGSVPVNVKFLLEGEEEIGSPSVDKFMDEHAELLACDFVISADGAQWRPDEPSLIVASRGSASLEVTVQGAMKDLHSGRHGGTAANPNQALAYLVSSLRSPEGRILVEGFYDQVLELTDQEKREINAIAFDEKAYLSELDVPEGFGEPGYSVLERQWTRPTLDIVGMWGGYQGEGIKTVIPSLARAKISCRLVPDQDPKDVKEKIKRHLDAHCPPGVHLRVEDGENSVPAYRIPVDHVGLTIANQVLTGLYQTSPQIVRIGATLPIADAFKRILKVDTIFFSFSTSDEDFHAPDEFFRLKNLERGMQAWAQYLLELASASPIERISL